MSSLANVSSTTRWIVVLSSATSSLGKLGCLHSGPRVLADEVDDVLHRRSRQEDAADADLVQARNVDARNDPAHDDQDVGQSFLPEQLHDPRADVHMCAGEKGLTD